MFKNTGKVIDFQGYFSVDTLLKTSFEDDEFLIDNLLPRGSLSLLSSRPKAGKTNLALQMATCLASGKLFLGRRTKKSKVLFISLELNPKQMKKRLINTLNHYQVVDIKFRDFPFVLRFSSERKGIEALESELEFLREKYNITFDVIFIDTYVLFKDINKEAISKHKSVYELESEYLAKLRKFCEDNNSTIVLIYHNRKSQVFAGDITENIMGSTGIAGAVNEIFLLERKTGDDKAKLIATGHNIEEQDFELIFEKGLFKPLTATEKELRIAEKIIEYLGQVGEATQSEIINFIKSTGETKRVGDITEVLNKFDLENNKAGFWKCSIEKRSRGKPIRKYSLCLSESFSNIMEQKKLDVEDLENLQSYNSEGEELSGSEEEPNEVDEIKELEEIELNGLHEAVDF